MGGRGQENVDGGQAMRTSARDEKGNTPVLRFLVPERVLAHGLPALIIGGALLLAVIWATMLELTSMLARVQVEQRMAQVAAKVQEVMQNHSGGVLAGETRAALSYLLRFHDLQHLELVDANGRSLWHGESAPHAPVRPPVRNQTLIENQMVDGLNRAVARHYAELNLPAGHVRVLILADVSDIMRRYRHIGILLAKAFSSVVLVAIFLMGWLLILRWREQRALLAEIRELLDKAREKGGKGVQDWQKLVEEASAHNATLLRQVLALVKEAGAGVEECASRDRDDGQIAEATGPRRTAN